VEKGSERIRAISACCQETIDTNLIQRLTNRKKLLSAWFGDRHFMCVVALLVTLIVVAKPTSPISTG